ncbi:MAG: glycosyltransferase [Aeromicrobium sp.]
MQEIEIVPTPLALLAQQLAPDRIELLMSAAERARAMLHDRTIWNVNATAHGGGVAEMLQALLAYGRGAGVDLRWLVLDADAQFFATTKRLHNLLHGSVGDGGGMGDHQRKHYVSISEANVAKMLPMVKAGDVVLLHDPQTAGMVAGLRQSGAHVVWRSHIGRDTPTDVTEVGWSFLREFVEPADAFIFSRPQFAPDWIPREKLWIIPPSLDPFSTKNIDLDEGEVAAALRQAGLVDAAPDSGSLVFKRRGGSTGTVRRHRGLILEGYWIPRDARVVMQVSRWDRLKDMVGVMRGFSEHIASVPDDVHLLLVGPDVSGVTDDPEGAEVLQSCMTLWRGLPAEIGDRIHLCCLPMDDVDENAHLVNALQRYATVVVQKSLEEGFGLTVTEPMWKAKPVVASAIGGIQDQIDDGVSGILLPDPENLGEFMDAVRQLLDDPVLAKSMGAAAQDRVREVFLGDRHLRQYVDLFGSLIEGTPA